MKEKKKQKKMVECPECGGSGVITCDCPTCGSPDYDEPCDNCEATGQVEKQDED